MSRPPPSRPTDGKALNPVARFVVDLNESSSRWLGLLYAARYMVERSMFPTVPPAVHAITLAVEQGSLRLVETHLGQWIMVPRRHETEWVEGQSGHITTDLQPLVDYLKYRGEVSRHRLLKHLCCDLPEQPYGPTAAIVDSALLYPAQLVRIIVTRGDKVRLAADADVLLEPSSMAVRKLELALRDAADETVPWRFSCLARHLKQERDDKGIEDVFWSRLLWMRHSHADEFGGLGLKEYIAAAAQARVVEYVGRTNARVRLPERSLRVEHALLAQADAAHDAEKDNDDYASTIRNVKKTPHDVDSRASAVPASMGGGTKPSPVSARSRHAATRDMNSVRHFVSELHDQGHPWIGKQYATLRMIQRGIFPGLSRVAQAITGALQQGILCQVETHLGLWIRLVHPPPKTGSSPLSPGFISPDLRPLVNHLKGKGEIARRRVIDHFCRELPEQPYGPSEAIVNIAVLVPATKAGIIEADGEGDDAGVRLVADADALLQPSSASAEKLAAALQNAMDQTIPWRFSCIARTLIRAKKTQGTESLVWSSLEWMKRSHVYEMAELTLKDYIAAAVEARVVEYVGDANASIRLLPPSVRPGHSGDRSTPPSVREHSDDRSTRGRVRRRRGRDDPAP
jgi:hypothetical protein